MITWCLIILLLISSASIFIGFVLLFNPALAIVVQKRFYEKINWKIEPISMQKEVRNTRGMGALLVIIAILTIAYLFIKNV